MIDEKVRMVLDGVERLQFMTGSLSSEINQTLDRFQRTYADTQIPAAELKLWRLRLDCWHSALTSYSRVLMAAASPENRPMLEDYMISVDGWIDACKPDGDDISD